MADLRIPWVELAHTAPGAILTAALFAAGIVAFGPGLFAALRFIDRIASSPRLIDRLVADEAPRPGPTPPEGPHA